MFTLGLAVAEAFGNSEFTFLYMGVIILDVYLLDILADYISKKDK